MVEILPVEFVVVMSEVEAWLGVEKSRVVVSHITKYHIVASSNARY